jgi:hypothetical protein
MERYKSLPYWIHLIIGEAITQTIWWVVTTIMGTDILVKSIIAGILLLGVVFAVAWYLPKIQSKSVKIKSHIPLLGNPIVIAEGIHYYRDRSRLPKILDEFASTSEGAALWYTGYSARNELYKLKSKLKRLLLIAPDLNLENQSLKGFIENVWEKEPQDVYSMVEGLAKEAKSAGIQVEYLDEIPKFLMVISSPNTIDAWIRIEELNLSQNLEVSSSIRIYKESQPILYNSLYSLYETLWNREKEKLDSSKATTTEIERKPLDNLLEIARKQRDNPVTNLVITDRIWFEFKREAKLPFIWVRIYYKNLGVNDLVITLPEGYAYYNSERLPDRIVAQEGWQNVPANGGVGQFDLHIYIPIGFRDDVCLEVDNLPRREIRNLQLHEISSKVYIEGDDTRCVNWSLGGEREIFRPNV